MKRFRDLTVLVDPETVGSLISRIEGRLTDGWLRCRKWERKCQASFVERAFCFVRSSTAEHPDVGLVMSIEDRRLTVDNIVPKDAELSVAQYNAILVEFFLKFLHPAALECGLTVELSSDELTVEEAFGGRAMELLRRFSVCANKSISHPADQRRWLDFVIHAQLHRRSKCDGDESLLAKWLCDDGWRTDKVERLISEYEFAGELLRELERKELLARWAQRPYAPAAPPNKPPDPVSRRGGGAWKARGYQGAIIRWLGNFPRPAFVMIAKFRQAVTARVLP